MLTITLSGESSNALVLRSPELSESEQVLMKPRFYRTYSNKIYSYVSISGLRKVLWTCIGLTSTQITDLYDFMVANGGETIQIVDHLDRTWLGVILNSPLELVKVPTHRNSVTIEFRGQIQ